MADSEERLAAYVAQVQAQREEAEQRVAAAAAAESALRKRCG